MKKTTIGLFLAGLAVMVVACGSGQAVASDPHKPDFANVNTFTVDGPTKQYFCIATATAQGSTALWCDPVSGR